MGLGEIFFIAIGLAMDAFAASVCKGLSMKGEKNRWIKALVIALLFGVFQAVMPLLGYFLGSQFASFVEPVDHWIAFVLLTIIGGKMIWDAVREKDSSSDEDKGKSGSSFNMLELVGLAVATSIDAFIIGCSFAFMNVNIVVAVTIIGVVTFVLSIVGVILGNHFGTRYNKPASIIGGVVLVLIGIKTLLDHLGILPF